MEPRNDKPPTLPLHGQAKKAEAISTFRNRGDLQKIHKLHLQRREIDSIKLSIHQQKQLITKLTQQIDQVNIYMKPIQEETFELQSNLYRKLKEAFPAFPITDPSQLVLPLSLPSQFSLYENKINTLLDKLQKLKEIQNEKKLLLEESVAKHIELQYKQLDFMQIELQLEETEAIERELQEETARSRAEKEKREAKRFLAKIVKENIKALESRKEKTLDIAKRKMVASPILAIRQKTRNAANRNHTRREDKGKSTPKILKKILSKAPIRNLELVKVTQDKADTALPLILTKKKSNLPIPLVKPCPIVEPPPQLLTSAFSCMPSAILFKDFTPDSPLTQTLTITNTSCRANCFKILPVEPIEMQEYFSVSYVPAGRMSAGMTTTVVVEFNPTNNICKDLECFVTLKPLIGKDLIIPVKAKMRKCCPVLIGFNGNDNILISSCVRGITKSKLLKLQNTGSLATKFSIEFEPKLDQISFNAHDNRLDAFQCLQLELKASVYGDAETKCTISFVDATPISFNIQTQLTIHSVIVDTQSIHFGPCLDKNYKQIVTLTNTTSEPKDFWIEFDDTKEKAFQAMPRKAKIQPFDTYPINVIFKRPADSKQINFSSCMQIQMINLDAPFNIPLVAQITTNTISVEPISLEFGQCTLDTIVEKTFTLRNESAIPQVITLSPRRIHGPSKLKTDALVTHVGSIVLHAKETKQFQVTFEPKDVSKHYMCIELETSLGFNFRMDCAGLCVESMANFDCNLIEFTNTAYGSSNSEIVYLQNCSDKIVNFEFDRNCIVEEYPKGSDFNISSGLTVTPLKGSVQSFSRIPIHVGIAPTVKPISKPRITSAVRAKSGKESKPNSANSDRTPIVEIAEKIEPAETALVLKAKRFSVLIPGIVSNENSQSIKTCLQVTANFVPLSFQPDQLSIDFGTIPINSAFIKNLFVSNAADKNEQIQLSSWPLPLTSPFRLLGALRPFHDKTKLRMQFRPDCAGQFTETFKLYTSPSMETKIQLKGEAFVPKISVENSAIDFGTVLCGESNVKNLSIVNSSAFPVECKLISIDALFSVENDKVSVAAASSLQVKVTFNAPNSKNSCISSSLTLQSNGIQPITMQLSATTSHSSIYTSPFTGNDGIIRIKSVWKETQSILELSDCTISIFNQKPKSNEIKKVATAEFSFERIECKKNSLFVCGSVVLEPLVVEGVVLVPEVVKGNVESGGMKVIRFKLADKAEKKGNTKNAAVEKLEYASLPERMDCLYRLNLEGGMNMSGEEMGQKLFVLISVEK